MDPQPASNVSPEERGTVVQVRKGLEGVVVSDTQLSDVDGANCRLVYRGYSIDELVGKASYEEVSYLLLFGHLPTQVERDEWTAQLAASRALAPDILRLMQQTPMINSMSQLRTVVSAMGLLDETAEQLDPQTLRRQAVSLIAKTPTLIATAERLRRKQPMLGPRQDLGHAANFLYMLHGEEPPAAHTEALDAYMVLLAEHGFNASTFSARTTVATQSDMYSGVVAAIGTLKGPLHGAANTKAMEMLMEIGSADRVESYVQKTLSDHKRFMGFGHRVYKGEDPRAKHLKRYAQRLAAGDHSEGKWFEISERLQHAVQQAKQLYINVDFYSASLLYYIGIPVDLFTPMFACARMAGWTAHIMEQLGDNRLIRPLANYTGPRDLRFIPIDQRPTPAPA